MSSYQRISVEQAQHLINTDNNLVIADVRDPKSYKTSAIPNAIYVSTENFITVRKQIAKDNPVLIYCYHGNFSQDMAQMFIDFGYQTVYSMDGGYEAWRLNASN